MNNEYVRARNKIIERVKMEMLGPGSEGIEDDPRCEVISDSPIKRYSLGVLFPQQIKYHFDDMEKEISEDDNANVEQEICNEEIKEFNKEDMKRFEDKSIDTSIDEEISMANETLPSAMGITFFAKGDTNKLVVHISCAKYRVSTFRDCKIKVNNIDDSDIDKYALGKLVNFKDGYLCLKDNTSSQDITNYISGRKIREDIVSVLYKLANLCTSEKQNHTGYVRIPFCEDKKIIIDLNNEISSIYMDDSGNLNCQEGCLKITVLKKKYDNNVCSYTVVLINENKCEKKYNKCFFQPKIKIDTQFNDFIFIDKSKIDLNYSKFMDDEDLTFNILYRNKQNYAVGHGVATGQNVDINTGIGTVFTDFFPEFEIPQLDFNVQDLENNGAEILSMYNMSDISQYDKKSKIKLLYKFADSYEKWIKKQKEIGSELKIIYEQRIINKLTNICENALDRIKNGIDILQNNENAYNAFSLMNRAMLMQRVHSKYSDSEYDRFPGEYTNEYEVQNIDYTKIDKSKASWRAFQLAFILLNVESITNQDSKDRDTVDLIWIPTGGGKTEAYLGITGYTIFLRRLNDPINGGGTAIIMRYTLRLLASQQFIRASILICACEVIRREVNKSKKFNLGSEEISIGLWVGGDPTPNTNEDAKSACKNLTKRVKSKYELDYKKSHYNKFQVLKCPWCGTKLEMEYVDGKIKGLWGYDYDKKKIIRCCEPKCNFNKKLPIQVVDEELYKNPPTLLFGTVDKFAALPWKGEIANLFALNKGNSKKSPELIIQDELHLISGPLGSMVGLYETAIDAMCSFKGVKPKIIASTATIKRAEEQCKMLFDRNVMQFPPSGLNIEDNFFTHEKKVNDNTPGRKYIGLMPSGKTTTTTQIRLYTALIESMRFIDQNDKVIDKYWTLVGYFNSIRELAKTTTLAFDDIPSNIVRYMKRVMKYGSTRYVRNLKELTSRLSSTEIVNTLKELENMYESTEKKDDINYAIDILLATNMISVGVDVSRLNLMVVTGQPKQTSEYIQATSRVGRKYPGLVFTLYNASKTRDRSHYELFYPYHQTFYKYVEPTSITPYSEPARERALHAVFISMIRHIAGLNDEDDVKNFSEDINNFQYIKNYIIKRIRNLSNNDKKVISEIECELDDIIEKWKTKITTTSSSEKFNYSNKKADKRLIKSFTDSEEINAYPTMQSMRNVDNQAGVQIIVLGDDKDDRN